MFQGILGQIMCLHFFVMFLEFISNPFKKITNITYEIEYINSKYSKNFPLNPVHYWKNSETFLRILGQLMYLIFIIHVPRNYRNLPEKFTSITCEIREIPTKTQKHF